MVALLVCAAQTLYNKRFSAPPLQLNKTALSGIPRGDLDQFIQRGTAYAKKRH